MVQKAFVSDLFQKKSTLPLQNHPKAGISFMISCEFWGRYNIGIINY